MNKMLQVQNPHTGRWEPLYVTGLPDPPEPQPAPVIRMPEHKGHGGHPFLIAGIVLGAVFGLLACLPASVRGWVVLAILAGIAWLVWTSNHDQAAAHTYAGSETPVAAHHYSDYAPRAELVKLPK